MGYACERRQPGVPCGLGRAGHGSGLPIAPVPGAIHEPAMLEVTAPQPHTDAPPVVQPAQSEHHLTFHDVLSMINPLQVYAGDRHDLPGRNRGPIPEMARQIGSIIVGGLIGGPVGAAISVAMIAGRRSPASIWTKRARSC